MTLIYADTKIRLATDLDNIALSLKSALNGAEVGKTDFEFAVESAWEKADENPDLREACYELEQMKDDLARVILDIRKAHRHMERLREDWHQSQVRFL